jgi:hypothetical protein
MPDCAGTKYAHAAADTEYMDLLLIDEAQALYNRDSALWGHLKLLHQGRAAGTCMAVRVILASMHGDRVSGISGAISPAFLPSLE